MKMNILSIVLVVILLLCMALTARAESNTSSAVIDECSQSLEEAMAENRMLRDFIRIQEVLTLESLKSKQTDDDGVIMMEITNTSTNTTITEPEPFVSE